MNGLHITGMKLSSPVPTKKVNTTTQIKPKETPINKSTTVKRSGAPVNPPTRLRSPVATKKQAEKKAPQIDMKKEVPKKVEQGAKLVAQKKQQQPPQKKQEEIKIVEQPKKEVVPPVIFEVFAKYNHYKDKFSCTDGVLSFALPNEKYCFGLVFKGNYQPVLRNFKTRTIIEPLTTGKAEQFSWKVEQNETYEIQIQEDEEQQSKYERHVYRAPEKPKVCPMKKNQRVQELTNQMRNMGVEELGSQKHRQMLEQRDLEDILFS